MEKLLKPYDKEYMRMAMLKHEETFKEQVYELHRLYQVQKVLMRRTESNYSPGSRNRELWNSKKNISFNHANNAHDMQHKSMTNFDLEMPAEDCVAESNCIGVLDAIDESEIELTLGPTIFTRKNKPETPRTSDSGPSFSSSSTGSSHINRTNQRNHQAAYATREANVRESIAQVPDLTFEGQGGRKNNVDVEEQFRQERLKQPSWLFQVLSLNMT
ncbi:hypothetical protein K2173_014695 [Erythroxylum novogranatense]|uniref:Uncharacterized protein n=1 Tax=Erythroxylum novogranatense TaxID=1862640 RepID=A0AAV8THZ1_9ROSI|nr:hypothetical protein K2173_014695 [Erythroxylum novogranatense]